MQTFSGGIHPQTASLKNVLAAQGLKAPHTGQPYTEAMLLGIGGGLGAGYILWEFKREESAHIVLGFRNRWNYAAEHMAALCERIGVRITLHETSGAKGAAAQLQAAIDQGTPVISWADKAHLPYQQLPESLKGYVSTVVGIHGTDGSGAARVDDLASNYFAVPMDALAAARGRIVSDKNRLVFIHTLSGTDLEAAVRAGLRGCVEHLGSDSESFALPAYKKWARMMTDTKNKKGWPTVFATRKGLYNTLRSIFEGIALDGTDGAGLRLMYADFLDEAASALNQPDLAQPAALYRAAAAHWAALAESALPDSAAALKETKDLLRRRYQLLKNNQIDEMIPISDQLARLQRELNREFPMDGQGVKALFAALQDGLSAIYEAEREALEALRPLV